VLSLLIGMDELISFPLLRGAELAGADTVLPLLGNHTVLVGLIPRPLSGGLFLGIGLTAGLVVRKNLFLVPLIVAALGLGILGPLLRLLREQQVINKLLGLVVFQGERCGIKLGVDPLQFLQLLLGELCNSHVQLSFLWPSFKMLVRG